MDANPHVWGMIMMTSCTMKKEDIAFGGTLAGLGGEIPSISHQDASL
jgi:hypothetical protein